MAKPLGDHTPLGGFVPIVIMASVGEMSGRKDHTAAASIDRGFAISDDDLAKRYSELQRLRELEKGTEGKAGGG